MCYVTKCKQLNYYYDIPLCYIHNQQYCNPRQEHTCYRVLTMHVTYKGTSVSDNTTAAYQVLRDTSFRSVLSLKA